ncbi:putative amidohydrolase [Polymorphobacter glacialis]|uniref:Amidohydrolase n=1 Tax=Sandarakinorhabdus glacialis TaxID=1614636 RepID=A0A916ZXJ8_9SPHN|nr:amidohydrolase [Polymorphobacter glacialis]GGE16157.1 putative amidohydrolase [Polymorphobacter glacialis]
MKISQALAAAVLLTSAAAGAAPTDLITLYKDLHSHPELSLQETRTAGIMAAEARAAGFTVTEKVGGTGVVAVMVNGPGPVVLIRTDMDGLPVKEATGLSYASTAIGKADDGSDTPVMHACGHDIHMSVWVGTAREMAKNKAKWSGTLVMIAQPAEEIVEGAAAMLKDGLFTRFPKPQFALALHDDNRMPAGQVSVPPGPALSSASMVDITVRGRGGHGAYPQTTKDPVTLAASIVTGLQTLISRENDPSRPAVITVGSIHGGTKHNIISDEVKLQLTVRSYDAAQQQRLVGGIARVARGEAIAAGIPDDRLPIVKTLFGTAPTLNTPALAARLEKTFAEKLGAARVVKLDPSMASEDFNAFNLADPTIESAIFWLGAVKQSTWDAAQKGGPSVASLHNAGWAPDPVPTIAAGVEAMTIAAMDLLAK